MKIYHLFIIFIFFFSAQTVFATSISTDCTIAATLRVFSKSIEVKCLQGKVGVVADGNFGPLTKAAVLAFQSSNGLVADGIVGPLTRAMLNGRKASDNSNTKNTSITNTNPNLVKIDQFIETVIAVNKKNGSSEKDLQFIADTLRKAVANSDVDYNKNFKDLITNDSKISISSSIKSPLAFFDKFIAKTLSFLGITPSIAQAAALPFGGALIFPFYCAESANWLISITPLPPTEVALLSYIPGTQGFASYNIPFTNFLLGYYTPPGICLIPAGPYVITITTEGTILPIVGSSPL